MKTKDVTGHAGLLLRVDGSSGPVEFDNMQDRGIKGTNDWKKYSVKLNYPEKKAKTINIGGIIVGKGQAWFDNFDVLIDGVSIKKIVPKAPELYGAQKDKEFDEGSGIDNISLNDNNTRALVDLGKIWGYVKYHHPKLATGEVNWDYELFRILPKYVAAPNQKLQEEILVNWINQLGTFEQTTIDVSDREIKLQPDYSWIGEVKNKDLKNLLIQLKTAKRPTENFYMAHAPNIGNPLIENENGYWQFDYPDAGFRLLALYRYWNIIQYFFPYKHLTDDNWNDVLADFLPKFVNTKDELTYKLAALELIGKVQDTHANVWGGHVILEEYKGKNVAPIKIEFVEEQVMVTGYIDEELGKATGLQKGDLISKVNGKSVAEHIKKMLPYTPASNYPTQLRNIARKLLRTNDEALNVTFSRNGKEQTQSTNCKSRRDLKYKREEIASYKELENDIGYIYPGTLKNGDVEKIKETFKDKKGIVVDLRCYPSIFVVFSLGEFFMSAPTDFVKFTQGNLEQPGRFDMTPTLKVGKDNPDYFKGKIAILINETTQSQAEYTTMAFRVAPQAKVFGSTTAGADGNVSEIILPGKIKTMISGIGVYTPAGEETQRVGIIPDVEVKPTIKGKQAGKDEVLEKALEWLNK